MLKFYLLLLVYERLYNGSKVGLLVLCTFLYIYLKFDTETQSSDICLFVYLVGR